MTRTRTTSAPPDADCSTLGRRMPPARAIDRRSAGEGRGLSRPWLANMEPAAVLARPRGWRVRCVRPGRPDDRETSRLRYRSPWSRATARACGGCGLSRSESAHWGFARPSPERRSVDSARYRSGPAGRRRAGQTQRWTDRQLAAAGERIANPNSKWRTPVDLPNIGFRSALVPTSRVPAHGCKCTSADGWTSTHVWSYI